MNGTSEDTLVEVVDVQGRRGGGFKGHGIRRRGAARAIEQTSDVGDCGEGYRGRLAVPALGEGNGALFAVVGTRGLGSKVVEFG